MIPVVYIHDGDQPYLRTALEQAKRYNDEVVLLGIGNKEMWSPWYPWVSERLTDFQAVYQHMNTNPESFEVACFYRWFALHDWMTEQGVERVFYCDTDVMLYCNVTEWAESVGNPDVSFQVPQHQPEYRWSASAHVSLWTAPALAIFCNFIMAEYVQEKNLERLREKWAWHQETGTPGGICDMTILYIFWQAITDPDVGKQLFDLSFVNNAQVIDGATFDHNINVAENYEEGEYWELTLPNPRKEIWRGSDIGRSDAPFFLARGFPVEHIRANALHFQGAHAKALMEEYKS